MRASPLRLWPGLLLLACISGAERWHITVDPQALAHRDAFVAAQPLPPARRLNVLLVVADDLGLYDTSLSPTRQGLVETQALAKLAHDGVRFTHATVTSPVCSPSRAALLTGRYPQRFGHEGQPQARYPRNLLEYAAFKYFVAGGGDWQLERPVAPAAEDVEQQGLPPTEVTLAEVLKRRGYATGAIGKWHLGSNPRAVPHHRGFDTHVGYYEAYTPYQADLESPQVVNQRHTDFSDRFIWGKGRTGTSALVRNGVTFEDPGYLTDTLTDEAIAFVDAHRAENFFLYVAYPNPHTPFQAKRALYERFADEPDPNRRVYKALIASLDESVGRLLSALEERGLADDTLVIFLSDNGGALYTKAADNRPLQGGKFSLFEGGIRVPMVMRWPNGLPAGAVYTPQVSSLDVFATVAAAAQAQAPQPLDGVDLRPSLEGERGGPPHPQLFWRAEYAQAVREDRWKLVRDTQHGRSALFDLLVDPGEANDLSAQHPEQLQALEQAFQSWEAQTRPPLWPHVMEYRFRADDGREFWFPM